MPERGVSVGDPVNTAAHVATPQWQSFETRMRHRRAERCMQRAEDAIDAGRLDEAGEALAEVRTLEPLHPGLQGLSDRIAALQAPPPAMLPEASVTLSDTRENIPPVQELVNPDLADLDLIDPLRPPELFLASAESRSTFGASIVAFVALALSAYAGWLAVTQWPSLTHWPSREPKSETRADIDLPSAVREDVPSPGASEAGRSDAAVLPDSSPEPVASLPEEQPGVDANAASAPDAARESVNRVPPAIAPPATPESTTGTVPAPAVPPPSLRINPRPIGEDAPRASPQPSADDAARALPPPAVDDLPRPSTPPATAGVSTFPPSSVAAPVEPNRPAAVESAQPSQPALDEHVAVRAILARYAAAFSDLDSAAARAVWPGVDQRALARAFEGLASQRVTLGACEVGVNGQTSHAICTGSATWTPKVGGGRQTRSRVWTFDLRRGDGRWQIVRVDTR